jgi:hypothetical protein
MENWAGRQKEAVPISIKDSQDWGLVSFEELSRIVKFPKAYELEVGAKSIECRIEVGH